MTFLFSFRFTKHICRKQNMLQQQLKKLVRTKLSKHSHIWKSRESILSLVHKAMSYFCLTRFVGFGREYMLIK